MGLDSPETGKALGWMILAEITRSKPQPVPLLYSSILNLNTYYLHLLLVCLFSIISPPYLWILIIGSTIRAATQSNKPGNSPQWPVVLQDQTFSDRPTTPVTVIFSFTCSRPYGPWHALPLQKLCPDGEAQTALASFRRVWAKRDPLLWLKDEPPPQCSHKTDSYLATYLLPLNVTSVPGGHDTDVMEQSLLHLCSRTNATYGIFSSPCQQGSHRLRFLIYNLYVNVAQG